MLYDTTATDATFVHGRAPEEIDGIIDWARAQLPPSETRPWRLISARRRFGKTLFEVEEETSRGRRRLIGKLGKPERAETQQRAITLLRNAGFCPPSLYTVPNVVAWSKDRGFLLLEKVAGLHALAPISHR